MASGALALQGVWGGLGERRSLGVCSRPRIQPPWVCRATASVASVRGGARQAGRLPYRVSGAGVGRARVMGALFPTPDPTTLGCRATASVASVRGGAWQAGRLPYRVSGGGWGREGLWVFCFRPRIQPPWVVGRPLRLPHQGWHAASGALALQGVRGGVGGAKVFGGSFPDPGFNHPGFVGRPLRLPQSGVARGKRGACPTGCQGWVGCARVSGSSVPAPGFNHTGL